MDLPADDVRSRMRPARGVRVASGYVWLAALGFALFGMLQVAADQSARVQEYPFGCDPFGYLRMAKEIRVAIPRGRWPQFRLRTAQTRTLIDFMRAQRLPLEAWQELVAPHAHHYFPVANDVGVQYPPGTGLVLALFPEGRAVFGLNRAFLSIFGLLGVAILIVAGAREAFVSVALALLPVYLALEILAHMGELSFSINAVLPTLLLATLVTLTAVALRANERPVWASLAAFAAGCLLGLATLIRLPTILLAPGFLLLMWPSRLKAEFIVAPLLFAVGLFLCGVCPVLINQQHVAGAWYLPTYSAIDATMPDFALIRENFAYFLQNGPGAGDNWALLAAGIGFIAVVTRLRESREGVSRAGGLSWVRLAAAAFLLWGVPLLFFLTHRVTAGYYMVPAVFASIALLGIGTFGHELTRTPRSGVQPRRSSMVARVVVAGALLPGFMILQREWTRADQTPVEAASRSLAHPPVSLPQELASDHAWIWSDGLSGTLYYYTGKSAFKPTFADTPTRLMLYRFVFERGDAQYVVSDSQGMISLASEIQQMGGVLQLHGMLDGYPFFKIVWPANGPALPRNG